MEVRVTGNTVEYLRNNEVFYTSTKAPTFPLHVDAALSSLNSAAGDVTVHTCPSAVSQAKVVEAAKVAAAAKVQLGPSSLVSSSLPTT